MTAAQKRWLDANSNYRPIGVTGGHAYFVQRGTLHVDGSFTKASKARPASDANGAIIVGILEIRQPGEAPERPPSGLIR